VTVRTVRVAARYLGVVALHKWAIVVAGREVNRALPDGMRVSWRRLLAHDLSKLSRAELMPYAWNFANRERSRDKPDPAFAAALRHHYEHNDHHPEHFACAEDGTFGRMPDEAVVEMVIDWMAASRAYEGTWPCCGGHWRWLEHSWEQLRLHPANKALAGAIVCLLGYGVAIPEYRWDDAREHANDPRVRAKLDELHACFVRAGEPREPTLGR
jgi:hypothetical protein